MSNLPPGVTENMIPGNRPDDATWEEFLEALDFEDLTVEEARWAVKTGIATVKMMRVFCSEREEEIRADERMAIAQED